MALSFTQLPADVRIQFVAGDEVAIAMDFDRDLTGFSITAPIYVTNVYASGGGGTGYVTAVGQTAAAFTIENTNLAAGQIKLGLSETQTSALSPAISYRWYLRWVDPNNVTRTVLSGDVVASNP